MPLIPKELKYTPSHEWVYVLDDGTATIGITDYAQRNLGDVIFIELPLDGTFFKKGEIFGVIESAQAAADLHAPLSGTILEVNPDIDSNPELVNDSPFEQGWLVRLTLANEKELEELFDANAYQKLASERSNSY